MIARDASYRSAFRWLVGAIGLMVSAPAFAQDAATPDDHPSPAADTTSAPVGGVNANRGVNAAASIRRITVNAIPRLGGVTSLPGRPLSGVGPRPKALANTRPNWISGWPRIPDLPQVKAKIAYTNRIISRRDVEKNPGLLKKRPDNMTPRVTNGPTRAFQDQSQRLNSLRDAVKSGDTNEVIRIRRGVGGDIIPPPRSMNTGVSGGATGSGAAGGAVGVGTATGVPGSPGTTSARGGASGGIAPINGGACVGGSCGVQRTSDGRAIGNSNVSRPDERLFGEQGPAMVEPALAPLTDAERAAEFTRARDTVSAADAYLRHLADHEDDAVAARSLAVVLLLANKPVHAGDAMVEAYRMDIGLAALPYDAGSLPEGAGLGALLSKAAARANRDGSAGVWLTASVLAQAQNRPDTAARFIERARAAGLDAPIADAMVSALSNPGARSKEVADARAGKP